MSGLTPEQILATFRTCERCGLADGGVNVYYINGNNVTMHQFPDTCVDRLRAQLAAIETAEPDRCRECDQPVPDSGDMACVDCVATLRAQLAAREQDVWACLDCGCAGTEFTDRKSYTDCGFEYDVTCNNCESDNTSALSEAFSTAVDERNRSDAKLAAAEAEVEQLRAVLSEVAVFVETYDSEFTTDDMTRAARMVMGQIKSGVSKRLATLSPSVPPQTAAESSGDVK